METLKYNARVKTENGWFGCWTYESRRLAQLATLDLQKELLQSGHRQILDTDNSRFKPTPEVSNWKFSGVLNP